MTSYDAFFPEVLPFCVDCPEVVARNQIRNAAIEFCDRSDYLQIEADPIDVAADQARYELDPPADMQVARILQAYYLDDRLLPSDADTLRVRYGRDWRVQYGRPRYFLQLDTCQVVLCPIPENAQAEGLKLIAALRPTRQSTSCDDVLYERYLEPIAAGARARLCEMRGQPYYDPSQVADLRLKFHAGVNAARMERLRGLGRSQVVARPNKANL